MSTKGRFTSNGTKHARCRFFRCIDPKGSFFRIVHFFLVSLNFKMHKNGSFWSSFMFLIRRGFEKSEISIFSCMHTLTPPVSIFGCNRVKRVKIMQMPRWYFNGPCSTRLFFANFGSEWNEFIPDFDKSLGIYSHFNIIISY